MSWQFPTRAVKDRDKYKEQPNTKQKIKYRRI